MSSCCVVGSMAATTMIPTRGRSRTRPTPCFVCGEFAAGHQLALKAAAPCGSCRHRVATSSPQRLLGPDTCGMARGALGLAQRATLPYLSGLGAGATDSGSGYWGCFWQAMADVTFFAVAMSSFAWE